MVRNRTPHEVALLLILALKRREQKTAEGRKSVTSKGTVNTRGRISVKSIRNIANRKRITPEFIDDVVTCMWEYGYTLIELPSFYGIVKISSALNWTKMSDQILGKNDYNLGIEEMENEIQKGSG